jgi:Na+/alanine symporter
MVLPNAVALVALSRLVVDETKAARERRKKEKEKKKKT